RGAVRHSLGPAGGSGGRVGWAKCRLGRPAGCRFQRGDAPTAALGGQRSAGSPGYRLRRFDPVASRQGVSFSLPSLIVRLVISGRAHRSCLSLGAGTASSVAGYGTLKSRSPSDGAECSGPIGAIRRAFDATFEKSKTLVPRRLASRRLFGRGGRLDSGTPPASPGFRRELDRWRFCRNYPGKNRHG
ncbi:MAG: hypothetical protein QOE52_1649, partial [Mycobacterium sp.]|nr:hypothetical protein [Mycobacterium sp.]